jgi:hypothetical protein
MHPPSLTPTVDEHAARGLTSTGLTRGRCRTPVWFPNHHQVTPKSVPVHRRLRVPAGLGKYLPDLLAGSGEWRCVPPPGLPQRIRRAPGSIDRPLPARSLRGVIRTTQCPDAKGRRTRPPARCWRPASRPCPQPHAADGTGITATRGVTREHELTTTSRPDTTRRRGPPRLGPPCVAGRPHRNPPTRCAAEVPASTERRGWPGVPALMSRDRTCGPVPKGGGCLATSSLAGAG